MKQYKLYKIHIISFHSNFVNKAVQCWLIVSYQVFSSYIPLISLNNYMISYSYTDLEYILIFEHALEKINFVPGTH